MHFLGLKDDYKEFQLSSQTCIILTAWMKSNLVEEATFHEESIIRTIKSAKHAASAVYKFGFVPVLNHKTTKEVTCVSLY